MQTVITLPNAGTVKYTIALWFIGKSKTSINKVGITPDRKMVDDPKTKIDEVLESEVR